MKTILKVFITLIIAIPFNRAFADCTNTLSIFGAYCDSEGYYTGDTPDSAPSYGEIVQNCKDNKIIFRCYKFKDRYKKDFLERRLQKCCDQENTIIKIEPATRPQNHKHRKSDIKTDGDSCKPDRIEKAKKVEMKKGKCLVTKCDNGYKPSENGEFCEKTQKTKAKEAEEEELNKLKDKCITKNFPGAEDAKWDDTNKKCNIKCTEKTYKLDKKTNKCIKTDGDRCEPDEIEKAKKGEMKNGECLVTKCETGYEPDKTGKFCEKTQKTKEKEAEEEKLNKLKDLCENTKSDDGRWQPRRESCDCGDDKNWDTSRGCVLKSEQERKEKCKTENFPGAEKAQWDDTNKKCNITCNESTPTLNKNGNRCNSNAYINADTELSDLINQAYEKLNQLETANEKTDGTQTEQQ